MKLLLCNSRCYGSMQMRIQSSIKRIKSDRVTLLRKRYDAFLEEDKKRKERNEYILGCLDKMRYTSTTAVQLRPKTVFGEYCVPNINRVEYRPEKLRVHEDVIPIIRQTPHQDIPLQVAEPIANNLQLNIPMPRNYLDDATILNEISKKYILIPKLRTLYPTEHVIMPKEDKSFLTPITPEARTIADSPKPVSNIIESTDWKSKYNILEELKNKDNEEDFKAYGDKTNLLSNVESKYETPVADKYETTHDDIFTKYEEEIPEKDLPINQQIEQKECLAFDKLNIKDNNVKEPEITQDSSDPSEYVMKENEAQRDVNIDQPQYGQYVPSEEFQPETVPSEQIVEHKTGSEENNVEYVENNAGYGDNAQYAENNAGFAENNAGYVVNDVAYVENDAVYAENNVAYTENNAEFVGNDAEHVQNNEYTNPNETVEYQEHAPQQDNNIYDDQNMPIQVMSSSEFMQGIQSEAEGAQIPEQNQSENTPGGFVANNETLEQQENVVPESTAENLIDNSGIDAFEDEQRNMFYTEENAKENDPYQPKDLRDAYNAEYNQNLNYPQDQEYSYYEGMEQQEAYPKEINEHEETSQPYDQSYEQQYAGYQDYNIDQPQQEFEQQEGYEQQTAEHHPAAPEYEQMQQVYEEYNYEQQNVETMEQVEQVLDNEQGYQHEPAVEEQRVNEMKNQKVT